MPNHRQRRESIVEKGTAPDECRSQMKKFRKKPVLGGLEREFYCICLKVD